MKNNLLMFIAIVLLLSCTQKGPVSYFECRSEVTTERNYARFGLDNLLMIDTAENRLLFSDSVNSFFCNNPMSVADKMYFVFHFTNGESKRLYLFSNSSSYPADLDSPYCEFEKTEGCSSPVVGGWAQVKLEPFEEALPQPLADSLEALYSQLRNEKVAMK